MRSAQPGGLCGASHHSRTATAVGHRCVCNYSASSPGPTRLLKAGDPQPVGFIDNGQARGRQWWRRRCHSRDRHRCGGARRRLRPIDYPQLLEASLILSTFFIHERDVSGPAWPDVEPDHRRARHGAEFRFGHRQRIAAAGCPVVTDRSRCKAPLLFTPIRNG
jgi:hypothetical protein